MGFLDNDGLSYFWGKVTSALTGKQNTITAGDGLSKEGDTLSVTTPVRGVVTQAEFDALPEEQRNKGLYVIPDGGEGGGGSGASGGEIYSTEETRIGTWIDGKPLYRKTVFGKIPDNQKFSVIADIPNIDKIVSWNGGVNSSNGVFKVPIEHVDSAAYITTVYDKNSGGLRAKTTHTAYYNADIYITIEYTKTTDEGGVS